MLAARKTDLAISDSPRLERRRSQSSNPILISLLQKRKRADQLFAPASTAPSQIPLQTTAAPVITASSISSPSAPDPSLITSTTTDPALVLARAPNSAQNELKPHDPAEIPTRHPQSPPLASLPSHHLTSSSPEGPPQKQQELLPRSSQTQLHQHPHRANANVVGEHAARSSQSTTIVSREHAHTIATPTAVEDLTIQAAALSVSATAHHVSPTSSSGDTGLTPLSATATITPTTTTTIDPPNAAHPVVGNYEIMATLGKGAFSKVCLGRSLVDNSLAAVKFIDRRLASSPAMVDNIETEIDILKSVSHPGVIGFVDLIDTPSHRCVVMEYIPGVELFEYVVGSQGGLSESTARCIFVQLAQTIAYLHANNICHRDIKLENIMVIDASALHTPVVPDAPPSTAMTLSPPTTLASPSPPVPKAKDGSTTTVSPTATPPSITVKLIDFGLAVRIDPPNMLTTRCGSEEYAAPELVQALPYDGRRTDIWALGVVLFVLLFNDMPFRIPASGSRSSVRAMFHRIARADYRIPPNPSCSAIAIDLVRAILVASPARRVTMHDILQHPWVTDASSSMDHAVT